ncbi:uncharacterized protein LOC143291607 [Babylonia areolata]|uniref:uncharacterized protein LOC143291607 n=1 Tax=Babylonia areolata TaxID=304850 RepID=UPI003FCFDC8E
MEPAVSPHQALLPVSNIDPIDFTEENPGRLNNMFGSLFGVAVLRPETRKKLTTKWYKIISLWYPNLHREIFTCPPLHFKPVTIKPPPEKPRLIPELYTRYGIRRYMPVRYDSVKSDEAQQRILATFRAYARRKKMVCFILSNMEFQNYLNKNFAWAEEPQYAKEMTRPNVQVKEEQGDIDVLIIDKRHGVFVLEVKAIGDEDEIWSEISITEEKKFEELHDKLKKRIGPQVKKGKVVIRKMLSDFNDIQKINVRGGFVLPNVTRSFLKSALQEYHKDNVLDLLSHLGADDLDMVSKLAFCSEDMPRKWTPGEEPMTDEVFWNFDKVMDNLLEMDGGGENKPMSDDLYEQVVARFCGPLTSVKIFTEKTYPRVKLEVIPKKKKRGRQEAKVKMIPHEAITTADAARTMARRFSDLVLMQEQIDLLQTDDEFVHIEGPPGTGKTLLLLLRVLSWLDDGHMVWIVSLTPASRSVSHVLMEQVKKMIGMHKNEKEKEKVLKRLRMFMMTRAEHTLDREYFKRRLLKFRLRAMQDPSRLDSTYPQSSNLRAVAPEHDCKVCLALDETGMADRGLPDFFKWVSDLHKEGVFRGKDFKAGLNVWSASVERVGRPMYAKDPDSVQTDPDKFGIICKLKMPLRCPPSVQRALILVQPSLDQENVCCFTEEMTLSNPARQKGNQDREIYAADGMPVFLIGHGSHKESSKDIWFCYECGEELANYLKNVLHIGEEECDCENKPVIYEITEKFCPDCKKLTKGTMPMANLPLKYNDVMIVATQRAFQFSLPMGKFALAMGERGLKIAVNTTREEGAAPIPDDDVILIADVTSVHGLERAIIIVIPEVNDPPALPARYQGMLYPEPPLKPKPEKKKKKKKKDKDSKFLPKHLKDALKKGEQEGKDGITVTASGEVEEDIADTVTHTAAEAQPAKPDPHMEAGKEEGRSLAMAAGTSQEGTGDDGVEDETQDMDVDHQNSDTAPRPEEPAPTEDSDMKESAAGGATGAPPSQKCGVKVDDSQPSATTHIPELDTPYTYNDTFSKTEITAALQSLSPLSRKDVFYIGSRAVCQMILIHLGKGTRNKNISSDEPMQTEGSTN